MSYIIHIVPCDNYLMCYNLNQLSVYYLFVKKLTFNRHAPLPYSNYLNKRTVHLMSHYINKVFFLSMP